MTISADSGNAGEPLFYKVPSVAKVLQMDPRTVRRGVEEGTIPAVKIGSAIRVPAAWVRSVANPTEEAVTR